MKSSIKLFLAAIMFISATAFASAETRTLNKVATASTIDRYIDANTKGNTAYLTTLFSPDLNYQVNNRGKVVVHEREHLIHLLQGQKNIKQNCSTSYTLIDQNDHNAIAKIEMKYEGFTKVDYVSLINDGKYWKINSVITTYR